MVSRKFEIVWCFCPVVVLLHRCCLGILSPVLSRVASISMVSCVYPYLQPVCVTSPWMQYCLFVGKVKAMYPMPMEAVLATVQKCIHVPLRRLCLGV